jgi:membrane protein
MKAHSPISKQPAPGHAHQEVGSHAIGYLLHRAKSLNLLQIASNLTLNSIFAIVPLLAVVLALFTALPQFHDLSDALQSFMAQHLLPTSLSNSVMAHLNEFAAQASRLTAIGGAFLILTVMLLIMSIESALNSIWHVSKQRTITQRLLVYSALISFGPLLMGASLWASAYLARESIGLARTIPFIFEAALKLLPVMIGGLGFAALFIIVPNCKVKKTDALFGGFLSAGMIEIMKFAFAYYIAQFSSYTIIYGAFAALPVFLLWVYIAWLVVLSGALVTSAMGARRRGKSSKHG